VGGGGGGGEEEEEEEVDLETREGMVEEAGEGGVSGVPVRARLRLGLRVSMAVEGRLAR
jgi:hypothetical protein